MNLSADLPIQTPPSFIDSLDEKALTRLRNLVASAAHSTGVEGAVLVLSTQTGYQVVVRHGENGKLFELSDQLIYRLLQEDVEAEWAGRSVYTSTREVTPKALGFLASVSLYASEGRTGVLVVCDGSPRRLSTAQGYVLQTIAVAVGDQIELLRFRAAHEETIVARSTRDERLRLLESVVIHATDSILITEAEPIDLPGPRITYANAAFTRTTGYELDEVLGKSPRLLQGDTTDRPTLDKLRHALQNWKPVELELLNYKKDKTPFWVELSIVPVANSEGWYTHWVSVQRDITERKKNEENAIRIRLAEAHNLALANEVRERMRVEAELAYTAFHDHLTGLRNRAFFMDQLKTALNHASSNRTTTHCGIIFLDLDNFKLVNDSLGHRVGDLLLLEVASRLKHCSRPHDTVARMGGDEFTILLPDLQDGVQAALVAERILRELAKPVLLAGNEVPIAASIGLSVGNYTEPDSMLRDADLAMYRAKKEGGSRYAVFNEDIHERAMSALQSRIEVRTAIQHEEFELYYQPLVDTDTDNICGVEALLRWQHPQRGLVLPGTFIGIAEESGSIVQLGSWVLRHACRHFAQWQASLPTGLPMKYSVNVSSRQLDDPGFLNDLRNAIEDSGMDATALELEITESVFVENAERIGALFQAIRAMGVQIAFDDFGTGYSSLSYLERYPIDTLKIDQSFVQRLVTGVANADIVRMIVKLAQALDMTVSAEGVEDVSQRDALRNYGCTIVQGYLYGGPVPFHDMNESLLHYRTADHGVLANSP